MRRVGRPCRGQGHVFVGVVRQPETPLVEPGLPLASLAQAAKPGLQRATQRREPAREPLATHLNTALETQRALRPHSRRLTQGKRLPHGQIVHADDGTIAPILQGTSTCPAPCGRTPGIIAAPTAGVICATRVPGGTPREVSSGFPRVDNVPHARHRVTARLTPAIQSVAGARGVTDPRVRQARHDRGMLTGGIPTTVEPRTPPPTPDKLLAVLHEAGLHRHRTPHHVRLAWACGYSRPVVDSPMASLLARGAGRLRDTGSQGAVIQLGMTVIAHNRAALMRIRQQRLSKRAQTFRRVLRLRPRHANQFNASKN